jgi:type IV pilus assembly protein PilC
MSKPPWYAALTTGREDPADSRDVDAIDEFLFDWQGRDIRGRLVRGQVRAAGENQVRAGLRRQGLLALRVQRAKLPRARRIGPRDIAIVTRQLATLLKAGVPLLQSFHIVGQGHSNQAVARLLDQVRTDIETGRELSAAFARHPLHFPAMYCDLVAAGETAGMLDTLLERLASYMEKTETLKSRVRSALMYPAAVVAVALVVVAVIMVFVVPSFKSVFASFGAELPAATLLVLALSEFLVSYGLVLLAVLAGGLFALARTFRRSQGLRESVDRYLLRLPLFGVLIHKACLARWSRTLSTLFGAGVPLIDALDSVVGAAGNVVYAHATRRIRDEVARGSSLNAAMESVQLFPAMLLQMCAVGEESGSLDAMLAKVAELYEGEVDDQVAGLSSLLEPVIIVFLGVVIGGIVVAMYLPIFKLGQIT